MRTKVEDIAFDSEEGLGIWDYRFERMRFAADEICNGLMSVNWRVLGFVRLGTIPPI